MSEEDPDSPKLPKLLSVPGLMAVAIFGISIIVVSRLFGPENILREIVTELLASFGSTILLVAIFGFFFRTGVQRLLRWAPGGETFEEFAERLRELLQGFDVRERESEGSQDEEKLDRIEAGVRILSAEKLPKLENEIKELRKMLTDPAYRRRDQTLE
jgi:hypothetical protein